MVESEKRRIPELGMVTLGPLSTGVMRAAYERSFRAEDSERSEVFSDFVLARMLKEPIRTPEEIANLPANVIAVLVDFAADRLGIRGEFDDLPTDLSPKQRLYQAWLEWWKNASAALMQSVSLALDQSTHFQEALKRNQELVQQFMSRLNEQIAREQEDFKRVAVSFGDQFRQLLDEARIASQEIGTPLTQAGFWIPPSAPFRLLRLLKTLTDEKRDTPENVRRAIVYYYDAQDFFLLKEMVDDWQQNPYFAGRMHIIYDALEAHVDGRYSLSIPALLPLVEGILTEIVGRRAAKADGGIRGWTEEALGQMCSDYLREAYKDAVIKYVTGINVYDRVDPVYFTPQRFPEWLELHGLTGSQVLQRHAILHGVQVDYASKENSLRAFFLLDVLSWISRQEWDQDYRWAISGGC